MPVALAICLEIAKDVDTIDDGNRRTSSDQSNDKIVIITSKVPSFSEKSATMSQKAKYKIKVSSGSATDILTDLHVSQAATKRAGRYISTARKSLGMKEVAGTHVLVRIPSGELRITSQSKPTIIKKPVRVGKASKELGSSRPTKKKTKPAKGTSAKKVAKKSSPSKARKKWKR